MRKINRMICFLVVCVLLFFTGCNPPPKDPPEPKTQSKTFYEYFDTECAVFSYLGDSKAFSENAEFVRSQLEKYHRLFDIYFSYAGVTNLNTLNKTAKNAPVAVSDELFAFLVYAKEMYSLTNGKVNIAMGAVLSIWHDVREIIEEDPTLAVLPTKEQLEEANLHTHTTVSDGKLTPAEAKELFKSLGYSIVAYTDHELMVPHPELCDSEFLAITGYELSVNNAVHTPFSKTYHLNYYSPDINRSASRTMAVSSVWGKEHMQALITDEMRELSTGIRVYSKEFVQSLIDFATAEGALMSYNHPVWSLQSKED